MWLDDERRDGMGRDGMGYITSTSLPAIIYMKHDTTNNQSTNQPTNQPTKETRCNNNNHNNILQIHFYDDTPLFLRKIMSFFLDGWMERERERKREREKEERERERII